MNWVTDLFGFIAMITVWIGLLPQIVKIYKVKSADNISISWLMNYLIGSISWAIYGWLISSNFVFFSNSFGLITCLILIWQKFYYKKKWEK